MGVNKVDLATGETLIDLTGDTVTPETLAEGVTAHNSAGEEITGKMTASLSEVDASKVIFDEQVTTGYAVGNIELKNGVGILAEKGANLLQVMKNIWTKANPPAVKQPSVTVSTNEYGSYEAGYKTSQRTYTATFDKGSYEYDDDTGVAVTKWNIGGTETTTNAVSMSGTLTSITVTENTNTRIAATAYHTAGIVPKDSVVHERNALLMLQLITPCCIMDVVQVGEAFRLSVSVYTNLTPICCRVA